MKLIRVIDASKEWARLVEVGPETADPSVVLFKEFMPTSGLSVYEVASDAEALEVAAAYRLSHSAGPANCLLAVVDTDTAKALGLRLKKTKGGTMVPVADDRHLDIDINTMATADRVFRMFLGGEVLDFSQDEIVECLQAMVKDNRLDPKVIAGAAKEAKPPQARSLLTLVKNSALAVHAA